MISIANTCHHAPFWVLCVSQSPPPPPPLPYPTSPSPPHKARRGCSARCWHQFSSFCYRRHFLTKLVVHRWCNHYRLLPSQAQVGDADCSQSLPPQNYCQTLIQSLLSHCTGCWRTWMKLQVQCSARKLISMKTLVARTPSWIWFAPSVFVSESLILIRLFWIERKGCHYGWTFAQASSSSSSYARCRCLLPSRRRLSSSAPPGYHTACPSEASDPAMCPAS